MKKELLSERRKEMFQIMGYSYQRIDLLVVSLSGAGIYLCFETLKYLRAEKICNNTLIKVAGIFFLVSIITNFISQILGRISSEAAYESVYNELKGAEESDPEIQKLDIRSEKYGKHVSLTNNISAITMFIGMLICVIFFIITF
jgi:hypothetical protein